MNTLIYKRTHTGDPDEAGNFGIHDCMGRIRGWNFDAVIGVGGKSPLRGCESIAGKITWIGINPCKIGSSPRGPLLKFEYFVLWDDDGPDLITCAPGLYEYMFEDHHHRRVVMSRSLNNELQEEVKNILKLAENYQPTTSRVFEKRSSTKHKC